MIDELIDIYDSEMNLLGTALKSQAHREGLWHKVSHCWIITEDGNIWLRQPKDETFPALLDVSCAEHVALGETPKQTCRHKLEEELGLSLKEHHLIKMFTGKTITDTSFPNREFNPTYLLKTQAKLHDLKLPSEGTHILYEADIQDLTDLFFGEIEQISINGIRYTSDEYLPQTRLIGKAGFCSRGDSYYQKAFAAIRRFIDNQ